ncbi:hypothetical protein CH373_12915 [Leptospira perolatii]|uniref:Pappalysin-1 domain protein n=1 Tax=Leptospira perolatii TaxID=2023191 RepID=A0A2M9ZKM1_9LEPT|nr:pappalysin-1 domain protein [Leptospira perolatii]PJZ69982.1 hypothetical protein CH360_08770 [Leptospira perolatii]PJZ72610.1 hypothetical protein CH373_12915 [Leptospira perolatii]
MKSPKKIGINFLLFLISILLWNCPKPPNGDQDLFTKLFLLNEIKYSCDPSENVRTVTPSQPTFTTSSAATYNTFDSAVASFGTIFLSGSETWTGLGKDHPMGILYATQLQPSAGTPIMSGVWWWQTGSNFSPIVKNDAAGSFSTSTAFPVGSVPGYAAPGSGYDNFGSNSQLVTDFISGQSTSSQSIAGTKVINDIPQTCEEYKFRPEGGGLFGSSTTGLNKVWESRKKLTIRLIEVNNGANHVFSNSPFFTGLAGSNALTDRIKQIFSQNTVKIDVTFEVLQLDVSGLAGFGACMTGAGTVYQIGNISDDKAVGPTACSLAHLYTSTGANQNQLALNVFFISDLSSTAPSQLQDALLGISAGIPGLPAVGTPMSGMSVFVENHRSSGAYRDDLSAADLKFIGNTIAHEGSHFLGLYHPIEIDQSSGVFKDPLPETPECHDANGNGSISISECLGAGFFSSGGLNLMFPLGSGNIDQSQLTGEQGWVLRSNPLVY